MDVKSAFLNRELKKEVYITEPLGFIENGQEDKILKLRKALYGLNKAARAWNLKVDSCFHELGFKMCILENAVYKKHDKEDIQIVRVYIDDLIIIGSKPENVKMIFEMRDLGILSYY